MIVSKCPLSLLVNVTDSSVKKNNKVLVVNLLPCARMLITSYWEREKQLSSEDELCRSLACYANDEANHNSEDVCKQGQCLIF